jgi:hypothetical protein
MSDPTDSPIPPQTGSLPTVQVQSLTPTGMTGSVPGPAVPPPSVAPMPTPSVGLPQMAAPVAVELQHEPIIYHAPVAPPVKKNMFVEYWRKAGGGSFMISLLIHAGLLIAAYFVVETIITEPKVDFLPGGGSKQGEAASQELAQKVQNKKRSNLNKTTPMRKVVSNSSTAAISLPDVPMDTIDMPETSSLMGGNMGSGGFGTGGAGGGFGKGTGIGGQAGFTALPPTMKSRCSSAERLQKLKESGGTAECEKAVSTALEYLKSKQKPDGSWGTDKKAAMTGLALLCYLGRCETPDSTFYGENVMKGILYLIELQKKNEYGLFTDKPENIGSAYEHGIATYALGEMYTLARMGSKSLPGMREAFERGVKIIIDQQNDAGSWQYYTKSMVEGTKNKANDLSVTGWQYQALKAAKLTNLKIEGLHPAITKAAKYLESTQSKDGGFGNTNREQHYNQWNMTPVGALGLATLGKGPKSTEVKKGIEFATALITKEPPVWEGADSYGTAGNKLYTWYYFQQAFFQSEGEGWKQWNAVVLPQVLKAQKPDGSWVHPSGATGGDNIYGTTLCTLMLEVYYRYLKVGDREQGSLLGPR